MWVIKIFRKIKALLLLKREKSKHKYSQLHITAIKTHPQFNVSEGKKEYYEQQISVIQIAIILVPCSSYLEVVISCYSPTVVAWHVPLPVCRCNMLLRRVVAKTRCLSARAGKTPRWTICCSKWRGWEANRRLTGKPASGWTDKQDFFSAWDCLFSAARQGGRLNIWS